MLIATSASTFGNSSSGPGLAQDDAAHDLDHVRRRQEAADRVEHERQPGHREDVPAQEDRRQQEELRHLLRLRLGRAPAWR